MILKNLKDSTVAGGGSSKQTGLSIGGQFITIIDGTRQHERTVAHELGHSIWNLHHPDQQDSGPNPVNDPIGTDKLLDVVTNDPANLMTSGSGAGSHVNANNSFLRRYVWKIMQGERQ